MSHRRPFLRQTAAALLACGLIASLLPSFAAAQAPSTPAARAALFVGGSGASDANPGTASAPFATIQAAANVAMPGDVVKIRDGTYRETVVPANSGTPGNPIVFEADEGAEPVISGADLLTGASWQPTQHAIQVPGNHIYEATVRLPVTGYADESSGNTDLLANQIFVRSKMMPEARWPKMIDTDDPMNHSGMRRRPGPRSVTGWGIAFGSGGNPTNTLSDPAIPTIPGGWAGGRIKIYAKYLPNDNFIVSSAPGQISWQPHDLDSGHQILTKEYSDHGSFNYHLFGVLGALSAENEWFYDGRKLYLWAPGGGVPADVEYKARNHGFNLTGRSYITIYGLNFFACEIPTNGNSIWPSNARNWPGVVNNGAHPTTGVVPAPSNNIIIDTCRFKYPNHYQTIVKPQDGGSLQRELSELRLAQNNNISASRFHEAGIRFTGDNCVFRNSVVSHAAGSGIIATGNNFVMENNYLRDIDYQGTFAAGVVTSHFSTGAKILRNTFWRTGRSALHMLGPHQEVGYNDWSEFTKINVDGGGNYSQARWNNSGEPSLYHMGANLLGGMAHNGTESHAFEGLVFHHNWCHDSAAYEDGHALGAGIYFDDTTDGAIIHHNVCWNCTFVDMRAPNGRLDVKKTPLGLHFIYNNTFATSEGGTPEQELRMMGPANCQISEQYKQAPHSIDNNIYAARQGINRKGVDYNIKPSEISIGLEPFDASAVFVDPSGKSGGLGFQLKAGSPAINRGVSINASNITDSTGATIDYVDASFNGPAPDAGAYEYGKEPWVPGCTLPQEFIEGQPWERQWQ